MVQAIKSKKAIVFTILAIIIILPLFLLSLSFSESQRGYKENFIELQDAGKIAFIERDAVKNIYRDLLSISLNSIERDSSVAVKFNQVLLAPDRNYVSDVSNYKNFAEGSYSSMNNIVISLAGFNHTFKISPYNSTLSINGTALQLFSLPSETNYLKSIILTVNINSSFNGDCEATGNDGGSFPEVTTLTIIYVNISGGICTQSRDLNPAENNDKGSGKQFYQALAEPSGSIETKFGKINNIDGVFAVITNNATANITQLDIEYSLINEKVKFTGGNINLAVHRLSKNSVIVLAEE